jgi:hypothetical protein
VRLLQHVVAHRRHVRPVHGHDVRARQRPRWEVVLRIPYPRAPNTPHVSVWLQ